MPSHPRPCGGENPPSSPPSTLTGTGFAPSSSPRGDFVPDGVPVPAKTTVTKKTFASRRLSSNYINPANIIKLELFSTQQPWIRTMTLYKKSNTVSLSKISFLS
jgi:hypothetical protein